MKLEEILIPKVQEAVKTLYGIEITPAQVQFQKTRAEFEGDITLVVFPFVKAARKAPAMVAQEVGEALIASSPNNLIAFTLDSQRSLPPGMMWRTFCHALARSICSACMI